MEGSKVFANRLRWFLLIPALVLCLEVLWQVDIFLTVPLFHRWVRSVDADLSGLFVILILILTLWSFAKGFVSVFLVSKYVAPSMNRQAAKILAAIVLAFLPLYYYWDSGVVYSDMPVPSSEELISRLMFVAPAIVVSVGAIAAVFFVKE